MFDYFYNKCFFLVMPKDFCMCLNVQTSSSSVGSRGHVPRSSPDGVYLLFDLHALGWRQDQRACDEAQPDGGRHQTYREKVNFFKRILISSQPAKYNG